VVRPQDGALRQSAHFQLDSLSRLRLAKSTAMVDLPLVGLSGRLQSPQSMQHLLHILSAGKDSAQKSALARCSLTLFGKNQRDGHSAIGAQSHGCLHAYRLAARTEPEP